MNEFGLPETIISNTYDKLKVMSLTGGKTGCDYYRNILPLHMLKMHGAKVSYSTNPDIGCLLDSDVVIFPRHWEDRIYDFAQLARWENKLCIFDTDDDLDHLENHNPAYKEFIVKNKAVGPYNKFMSICDGVTTTTPELALWSSRNSVNSVILPNFIDFSLRDWSVRTDWVEMENGHLGVEFRPSPILKRPQWGNNTVIGWSGSNTHKLDLEQILPASYYVLSKYPNTLFSIYGSHETFRAFQDYVYRKNPILSRRVVHTPFQDFINHPKALAGHDILLAPLVPSQFNVCKSPLRILETLAVGAASVASHVGPYARISRQLPKGLVKTVGKGKDCFPSFEAAIKYYSDRPEELEKVKTEGRRIALQHFSLEENFHLWPKAWNLILGRKMQGLVGKPDSLPDREYETFNRVRKNDPCPCGSNAKYRECCNVGSWSDK